MSGSSIRRYEREVTSLAPRALVGMRKSYSWVLTLVLWGMLLCMARLAVAADEPSILDRYPGRMIALADHRIHLYCVGHGAPTVVFESRIGGFSLEWRDVQTRLAQRSRVCAYDRAGYGWSDASAQPADAARSAEELYQVLTRAAEAGPYLLVGHSYGGFILRWFARHHQEAVAGRVLLDTSAAEQFERLPAGALPLLPAAPARRAMRMPQLPDGFPAAERTTALALMLSPKARLATVAELRSFAASAHALSELPDARLVVPVLVVSRGRRVFDAAAGGAASEALWRAMQVHMTALSPRAALWVARGASHLVHLDRPDLVARAVLSIAAVDLGSAGFAATSQRTPTGFSPTLARYSP